MGKRTCFCEKETFRYSSLYCFVDNPGGTSILTYTGRAVFQGIIFQHKFLNRVRKLIKNSETGYDYLFKNNRLLFSTQNLKHHAYEKFSKVESTIYKRYLRT